MGKRIKELKRNNHGSTLILVLICMTFLGLLGSVILTATVSNMKMKTVDSLAHNNFYTAESAMNEFKIGIEETAQSCMKEAYTYMLQRYSTTPDTERTKLLMRKFVSLLYENLTSDMAENNITEEIYYPSAEMLKNRFLVSDTGKQATVVSGSSIKVIKKLTDYTVTLQGVTISYTDTLGYQSTITTDIKIEATYPTLSTRDVSKEGVYFTDFGLIADGVIKVADGNSTVKGNVYGGGGIHADNTSILTLNSNKIISREGLEARNKASIQILGQVKDDGIITNSLWVKNIATSSTLPTASNHSYLDIAANCYVQDDLTLGANYGDVKIAGNYYGYQIENGNSSKPADGSSSMIINAKNATLDLRELKNLWLSGKSYLKIPSLYGSGSGGETSQSLTGESLTFKGGQVAYLVPGKCISGIGHNPMTPTEYNNLRDKLEGYNVVINDSSLTGDINVSLYMNSSMPYKAYHVNFLTSDNKMQMVYLYWNFQSAKKADEYFREYQTKNADKLDGLAGTLQLGNVYLPDGYETLVNTGNILSNIQSHDSSDITFYSSGMHHSGGGVTDISAIETELNNKKQEYSLKYMGLMNWLKEDRLSSDLSGSLVYNLIRFDKDTTNHIDGIIQDSNESFNLRNTKDVYTNGVRAATGSYILITTNEVELTSTDSGERGLIITNNNVKLTACEFNGLIITTGNITLSSGAKINAEPELVKSIIDSTPQVNQYFKDFIQTDEKTDGEVNAVKITYENWYKE